MSEPSITASETDVAWVAGFYSGEGCTHVQTRRRATTRYYVNVTIGNTDLECLERCRAVIGGEIYGPTEQPNRKPIFMLKIGARADVERALSRLEPYLSGEKRDQAQRALNFVRDNQPPPSPHRGWPKGKARGRKRLGGEPCGKGHDGSQTYEYTAPSGRVMQKCRACQRDSDAARTGR